MNVVEAQWYVVRSQSKRERIASETIREMLDLEVIAPMVRYKKATKRGKVWWSEAMFPGYFFVKFVPAEHARAVQGMRGVLTVLKFGSVYPVISKEFIEGLNESIGEGDELVLEPKVEVGGAYEVANGPFMGFEGRIVEVLPGSERVRLLIEMLGQERAVEVDLFSILVSKRPDLD